MGVCLLVWVWGQKCDFFFWSKMSINEPKMFIIFFGQKCPSMSHKLSKKFFCGCATRWGKISINNPLSGVGLAHENLNSL